MDTLHEQLKSLILYINQNSEFDIFAVELKYYKHASYEIVIPRLFGSEVKKDLTPKTKPGLPSDQDFISAYTQAKQERQAKDYLNIFHDIGEGRLAIPGVSAHKTQKTATITVEHDNGKTTFALYTDPVYEGGGIQVWTYGRDAWKKAIGVISDHIPDAKRTNDIGEKPYARFGQWKLKNFTGEKLKTVIQKLTR